MRIGRRKDGREGAAHVRRELAEILHNDADGAPVCASDCPNADPSHCSRHCPDIPRVLSSDPEKHPIESGVAPLVYEIKRLEVFQPCWSCEGHNGPDGELWKIPRVWFYCESVVHLRVLADALKELHLGGKLSVPWRVTVTFSDDDNPDSCFSLEPGLEGDRPPLAVLRQDVDTIAERLHEVVLAEALKLSRNAG